MSSFRLPLHNRISVPRAGNTLLRSARKWGEPIYEAYNILQDKLAASITPEECAYIYDNTYGRLIPHQIVKDNNVYQISAAALLLTWIAGITTNAISKSAMLMDAEIWFQSNNEHNILLSARLSTAESMEVLLPIRDLDYGMQFIDVLPYVIEVFETKHEIITALASGRVSKRSKGVFYSPSDVTDYVISEVINKCKNSTEDCITHIWLDPACGTGCFLVSVICLIGEIYGLTPGLQALDLASKIIYGIDISPLAIQSAVFVLFIFCTQGDNQCISSAKYWIYKLRANFAISDSTSIVTIDQLASLFPKLSEGVDHIVTNPPYLRNNRSRQSIIPDIIEDAGEAQELNDVHLIFLHLVIQLTKQYGTSGIVMPMSISCSTAKNYIKTRNRMRACRGDWWIANFDRTPDSLFGDDVKTRNAIVLYQKSEKDTDQLNTTELIRWNSRNRHELFSKIDYYSHNQWPCSCTFPKVGDIIGGKLLETIEHPLSPRLGDDIQRVQNPVSNIIMLRNGTTAYNWLPFEIYDGNSTISLNQRRYHYWIVKPQVDPHVVLTILLSRFSYWLWRVWGDGFHLTDKFILGIPINTYTLPEPTKETLREAGQQINEEMRNYPIISLNAGVESISYCAHRCEAVLDRIDAAIAEGLGLPQQAADYVKEHLQRTIIAGRNNEELYVNMLHVE